MCQAGQENYCYERVPSARYGEYRPRRRHEDEGRLQPEYVLREKSAYPLPDALDPAAAAPLMCAGIDHVGAHAAAGVGPGSRSPWPAWAGSGTE